MSGLTLSRHLARLLPMHGASHVHVGGVKCTCTWTRAGRSAACHSFGHQLARVSKNTPSSASFGPCIVCMAAGAGLERAELRLCPALRHPCRHWRAMQARGVLSCRSRLAAGRLRASRQRRVAVKATAAELQQEFGAALCAKLHRGRAFSGLACRHEPVSVDCLHVLRVRVRSSHCDAWCWR